MKKTYIFFLFLGLPFFSWACDGINLDSCFDFSVTDSPASSIYDENLNISSGDKYEFTDSPIRFSIHGKARITTGVTSIKIKP